MTTVTSHGINWIIGPALEPRCPECTETCIRFEIDKQELRGGAKGHYFKWTAKCECLDCKCLWEETREEGV